MWAVALIGRESTVLSLKDPDAVKPVARPFIRINIFSNEVCLSFSYNFSFRY